jgi:hypothetical protein
MALTEDLHFEDRPAYADSLLGLAGFATQALTLAAQALVSGEELSLQGAIDRSDDVTLGHRQLTTILAGDRGSRALMVSSFVDEIGRAAARTAHDARRAAAVPAPRDAQLVDCLYDMTMEVARMTQAAVESFVCWRPEVARDLEAAVWRVRLGHRRIVRAATGFWPTRQREWAVWMVEIAQELERAAGIALAISEEVRSAQASASLPQE